MMALDNYFVANSKFSTIRANGVLQHQPWPYILFFRTVFDTWARMQRPNNRLQGLTESLPLRKKEKWTFQHTQNTKTCYIHFYVKEWEWNDSTFQMRSGLPLPT